jgi:hypothetical protein
LTQTWFETSGLGNEPIAAQPRPLDPSELEGLWQIATAIYATWELNTAEAGDPFAQDVTHLRSTWTEHVRLRAQPSAASRLVSYVGEYENALKIVGDLAVAQPTADLSAALQKLLFAGTQAGSGAPLNTPLLHAKRYVVDEFITVLIVGGGFRQFGGWNYNGFLGGSRFGQVTAIAQPIDQPKGGPAT